MRTYRTRRWWFRLINLVLLVMCTGLVCAAETVPPYGFPNKPVTIIVPFGQGGGSYQMATQIAVPLRRIMGVDVNVVTRPGNGGIDGTLHYMKLAPDGHTILQHVDILASLFATGAIDIHPVNDLTPVAITQITFSQIYIRNIESRFHTWSGFLDYARLNPNELCVATIGSPYSLEQISMQQLADRLDFHILSYSYDDPEERYMSLVEEKVDALFEQPGDVAPFLDRKLIKPILTIFPQRVKGFSNTPALEDIKADVTPLYRFRGFFIHSEVPGPIVEYLDRCFMQAYQSSSFKQFNEKKYMHLIKSYKSSDDAKKFIRDAINTYRSFVQKAG